MSPDPARQPAWRRVLLPLLLAFLASGVAVAWLNQPSDEVRIAGLADELQRAVEREQPEAIRNLLSDGFVVVTTGMNREELLAFLQGNAWQTFDLAVRVTSRELRRERHKAWLTLEAEVTFTDPRGIVNPFTERYRLVLEWRREAGGWKVIAAQLGRPDV